MPVDAYPLDLTAADGYRLGAYRYPTQDTPRARLVVAGATAVAQGFYRRFAQHAAARGFDTLTFDYRGIGRSAPASLKGLRMDLLDWGRQDLAAAVDAHTDPALPLFVIGHSLGGHIFGLLPDPARVAGFYVYGTSAGWHGYCPWRRLGLGEDLPRDAYRQWRRWCSLPHYFFDDPAQAALKSRYAAVRTPIRAVNALDDRWALPRSRDAFLKGYAQAPLECEDLDPRQHGRPIGHMGYFRRGAEPLWDSALDWFEHLPNAASNR